MVSFHSLENEKIIDTINKNAMKTSLLNKAFFFAATLVIGSVAAAQAQSYGRYDDRYDRRDRYEDRRSESRGRFNPEFRQQQQNRRIEQGIRSGQLSRREVRNLKRMQADADRAIWSARANGYSSPRERLIINDLQDRIDRAITWEKRDGQRGYDRW
ncbi:hypothetical protein QE357_003648 [Siphonobacter sp. BAB-5404]|nr:hypothetical protein [Siphonobacter sp. SORGH_AS_0500]